VRRLSAVSGVLIPLALAASLKLFPTSPPTRVALPGDVVTHVFRLEGGGGPYTAHFSSSAGFPILSRPRPVTPPAYIPVTERVPLDAREGTVDLLTVRVAGLSASTRIQVGYRPGLSIEVPEKLEFWPPQVVLPVEVRNQGNGDDTLRLILTGTGSTVAKRELRLKAFSRQRLLIPLPGPGTYHLSAQLVRGRLERTRTIEVRQMEVKTPGSPPRLLGEARAHGAYPSGYTWSNFSLRGKLSDYVNLRLYSVYSPGGAYGYLELWGEGWRLGGGLARRPWGFLELSEGPVQTRFSVQRPDAFSSRLRFTSDNSSHVMTFGLRPAAYLGASGDVRLAGTVFRYSGEILPQTGRWAMGLGLERAGWRLGYRSRGAPAPDFYRLELAKRWGPTYRWTGATTWERATWHAATSLLYQPTLDREHLFSVSTEALSTGAWFRLSREPHWELGLYATRHWSGARSFGLRSSVAFTSERITWDGRLDWTDTSGLRGRLLYTQMWDFWEGDLRLEAEMKSPWRESYVRLGWTREFGWERQDVALAWLPFKQRWVLEGGLRWPVEGVLLELRARTLVPRPSYSFQLGASYAFAVDVPSGIAKVFGGRRIGFISGRIRLAPGARVDLSGVRVVAGPYTTYTDSQGRFVLEVPAGRYEVGLDASTLPAALLLKETAHTVEVRAGARVRVEFAATLRGSVAGRVVVRADWNPPPQLFVLEIVASSGRTLRFSSDEKGRFYFQGLRPGSYVVRLLEDFLPPGWKAEVAEARVQVQPGQTTEISLVVQAPPKEVARASSISILRVQPEVTRLPPGAVPLVQAQITGSPTRVFVERAGHIRGVLGRWKDGIWTGRMRVKEEGSGTLSYRLVAEAGMLRTTYTFFVEVDPRAPWGQLRTRPVVRAGQRGVPVMVHLYAPAEEVWLAVGARRWALAGREADWKGRYDVPEGVKGRLELVLHARLPNGREVRIRRFVLVR